MPQTKLKGCLGVFFFHLSHRVLESDNAMHLEKKKIRSRGFNAGEEI